MERSDDVTIWPRKHDGQEDPMLDHPKHGDSRNTVDTTAEAMQAPSNNELATTFDGTGPSRDNSHKFSSARFLEDERPLPTTATSSGAERPPPLPSASEPLRASPLGPVSSTDNKTSTKKPVVVDKGKPQLEYPVDQLWWPPLDQMNRPDGCVPTSRINLAEYIRDDPRTGTQSDDWGFIFNEREYADCDRRTQEKLVSHIQSSCAEQGKKITISTGALVAKSLIHNSYCRPKPF